MASNSKGDFGSLSDELGCLSAGTIWKGENESDPELMEGYESPLTDAGVWTEEEACKIYREKLVRLRDLYVGQLDHLRHTLQEKRRQFLLQWQYQSRRKGTELPHGKTTTHHYRRKSGEEALLEHKLKQKRLTASLDYFFKKETRNTHKSHYQYLLKQHHHSYDPPHHCNNYGCDNKCLPFSNKCSRHICDDNKQFLYTKCFYVYPSGNQCTNPIPKYLDPLLCGGHCDNINPPGTYSVSTETTTTATTTETTTATTTAAATTDPQDAQHRDEITIFQDSSDGFTSLKDTVDTELPDSNNE